VQLKKKQRKVRQMQEKSGEKKVKDDERKKEVEQRWRRRTGFVCQSVYVCVCKCCSEKQVAGGRSN